MKLYHGTSSNQLLGILEKGIRPRKDAKGNWEKFPSRDDCVYLTDAYGFYYAAAAIESEPMLIVEVDVDEKRLLPDEDFIEQATRGQWDDNVTLVTRHMAIRDALPGYRNYWDASLLGLGNVAHQGYIRADQIKRYALVDDIAFQFAFDPVICLANYAMMGAYYRNSMKWLFDPEAEFEEDDFNADRNGFIRELPRTNIKVIPDEFGKDE